jgi:UDP-glucuronate decarboxylase
LHKGRPNLVQLRPAAPIADVLTVYGDGKQTRSFCYVDDLIDGLIRLMATKDQITGPTNIGNPTEFLMLELASTIIEMTGSRSRVVHRPLLGNDPRQRCPDISRAQELLSWAPRTQLKEGLKRTVVYFEKLLSEKGVHAGLAADQVT